MITHSFDLLASTYDETFSHSPIGQALRAATQARLRLRFTAGQQVLELGCGTGEDALFLAENGVQVFATDASPAMLSITAAKTHHTRRVQVEVLDLQQLAALPLPSVLYDGVFSNFGAVNCMGNWQALAQQLALRVKAGGYVCFGVMSPLCLWEMIWHGVHGEWRVATRRWHSSTFQPDKTSAPLQVDYPTIARLTHDFAPFFRRVHVQPVGFFLPPSDVFGVIEKRPIWLQRLLRWEKKASRISQLALFADHYWVEFERTE